MKPLLFASNRSFSGKSSMCVAIGKLLKEKGYKLGYMKPVCTLPDKIGNCYMDEDVRYIIDILELKDNPEDICPLSFTEQAYDRMLKEKIDSVSKEYSDVIKGSFDRISKDKDIVLIESARNITYGSFAGISSKDICAAVGAKTILIMKYEDDVIDKVMYFKNYFHELFGGIIINRVAVNDKDRINKLIIPYFKKFGVNVFGVLYSDSTLSSISIRDMAKYLEGEVLCAENNLDELVESFMVGAMGHEMALKFFRTKTDKVVITGGDRADIQLAALETNTKCLVLTGLLQPSPMVISRAEELGVPMVLVRHDTLTTISKINEVLGQSNLHEHKKLNKLIESVKKYIDLDKIIELAES